MGSGRYGVVCVPDEEEGALFMVSWQADGDTTAYLLDVSCSSQNMAEWLALMLAQADEHGVEGGKLLADMLA